MTIGEIINTYGRKQSPYMRSLVNHLPMGQLALFKLTNDLDKVKEYSEKYAQDSKINPVKSEYPKINLLEETLGKRELYESALEIIQEEIREENVDNIIEEILNKYILGMSAGIFHTLIRLAYGVEGYKMDKDLIYEVSRALAYYVTGYREGELFTKEINGENIIDEMRQIADDSHIKEIIASNKTLGQRLKALYNDKFYMDEGFIIGGDEDEKIKSLLKLLIPAYDDSGNIVVLHCITGLHALIVLKQYFYDFHKALNVFTTTVISHLMTVDSLKYPDKIQDISELSWDCIRIKGARSSDVHAIKLTYSAYELDKIYNIPQLKNSALKRIKRN